MTRFILLVLR